MSAYGSDRSIIERIARRRESEEPSTGTAINGDRAAGLPFGPAGGAAPPPHVAAPQDTINIDLKRLARLGLATPEGGRRRLLDEFRIIKRAVIRSAFQDPDAIECRRNLLMVTSAGDGEGKTSTAISLAMCAVAEQDRPVLLIDLDPIKQDLCKTLGALRRGGERAGLLDLLSDDSLSLSDVLLATNVPRLSLLPAGRDNQLANELLAGHRMQDLMMDLANWYRDGLVVIDTPPVLASTEPNVLASLVGQVIMVVEAHRTERASLENAVALVSDCDRISLVLNKASGAELNYRYGKYLAE